jgi:hypothetical protein
MRTLSLTALASAAILAACATPYQEMGALGGVRAVRITDDTAQITASGNAYTDPDTVQRYALRRAAEETIADGFDLFRIEGSADRTALGSTTIGSAYGTRYGAFGSAFTMPIIKPGETITIRMLKGPTPNPVPDGEYDAHDVVKYLAGTPYGGDHKDCHPGPDGKIVCQ